MVPEGAVEPPQEIKPDRGSDTLMEVAVPWGEGFGALAVVLGGVEALQEVVDAGHDALEVAAPGPLWGGPVPLVFILGLGRGLGHGPVEQHREEHLEVG